MIARLLNELKNCRAKSFAIFFCKKTDEYILTNMY